MSHHLDTPLARQNGRLYIDDLFVFPGDRGTVLIMDVNSDITGNDIQLGFHPEARYEFKVHLDGADAEDVTYRVSFEEPDSDGQQVFNLHVLTGAEARDDMAAGTLELRGRTGEMASDNGTRMWAGRVADPFYIDLDLLAQINAAFQNGAPVDRKAWRPDKAKNSFAGKTVQSIVLEISERDSRLRTGANIGVWCATKLATDAGGWRQINRAGHPMMWPIFWPDDTDFTDEANLRHPSQDMAADGDNIASVIASVVAANGTSDDPHGYGQTVARQLYPDMLHYQVGTPASFGFAVRNGRSLADNAPEAMFSLVLNTATPTGLTHAVSERMRDSKFPHVVAV